MDHVTPPEWSHRIAAGLPNARVVTVPLLGHFPAGLSHMECYDQILAEFCQLAPSLFQFRFASRRLRLPNRVEPPHGFGKQL